MRSKFYYKDLNLIRLLACIAILLYHLNILKGGYLAVCVFLSLSGYLSCISAYTKEKFSLISYYKSRLLKIYLPLVIVVFITIFIVSLFPNINWLNLKPETTSVLLGYNNYWQLGANLDYFARHINSPFMHLWYISILLQFDLIFPFIFITLRKIGDKLNKVIPCIITTLISIIGAIYFYKISLTGNIMTTYYETFTRVFSLFFGLSLGFIHSYYGSLVPDNLKKNPFNKIVFISYILILICLFIFIKSDSILFASSMIVTTLITCRLIDYATINIKQDISFIDKIIKSLTDISYEIYLVQYPVIFLFQYINIEINFILPMMILIILGLSYLLHFSVNFNQKRKFKILRYVILSIILFLTAIGLYKYIKAEDHTIEMKELEEQMIQNEKLIQLKQEEYASKLKQEEDDWIKTLNNLENAESELKNTVSKLPVVGVGDSVMLGAVDNLYQKFPNGYFDAAISRTAWVVNDILQDLKNRNILSNIVILNLGANGDCSEDCKMKIMKTCENSQVFWINTTNDKDVNVNSKLDSLATKYPNLHIIDWELISSGHPEYFVSDGIHLTTIGKLAYTQSIYDAIYELYLNEYNTKKEELIKERDEQLKTKISFYGNDILLNSFNYIKDEFSSAKYVIKNFDYETLKQELQIALDENKLTHKIVFAFDNTLNLSITEYQNLIELCKNHDIYILSNTEQTANILSTINYENVKIIDFYDEINQNNDYLMIDGIHLTEKGNQMLSNMLSNIILNENIRL